MPKADSSVLLPGGDIPGIAALVRQFVDKFGQLMNKSVHIIPPASIRELMNLIERAVILSQSRNFGARHRTN
jgi:hypothetical protein